MVEKDEKLDLAPLTTETPLQSLVVLFLGTLEEQPKWCDKDILI